MTRDLSQFATEFDSTSTAEKQPRWPQLVYRQRFFSREAARRRETQVNEWTRRQQEALILGLTDSYPA